MSNKKRAKKTSAHLKNKKPQNLKLAEQYYKMLAEIACDYPITQRLRKQLYPGFFRRIFRKMIGND
ncbi:hypothetical protein [Desulfobacter sp.]